MLKRFLFIINYPLIRLLFPTRVVGKKNIKDLKGATIVASNHFSNVDAILLSMVMIKYNFYYLAKKELEPKNRLAHWFFKIMNLIYIDRNIADLRAMREVTNILKNGEKLMIFPEGTRNKSNDDATLQMKGGVIFFASKTDATILPVEIIKRPRLFRFNTVVIGKPYKVLDTSKEGKEKEILMLEEKMRELRKPFDDKKNKKESM